MKKAALISFILILCILFFSMYLVKIQNIPDTPETTLIKSFNASGAKIVSSEIYYWGKVDKKDASLGNLLLMADKIAERLSVVKDSSFSHNVVKSDLLDKIELTGVTDSKEVISLNISIDKKNGSTSETILTGTITKDLSSDGIEETGKKLLNVTDEYGINLRLNTCITGNFEGRLEDEQLESIGRNIFRKAEAMKVEGMRDDKLISISAYSPQIPESIKVNGKKVNINMAIRYNSYENKTYIWLATPVITKEY